tara:strand:- start:70 stop:255 length:186 start_codon:yes stop_codon:yes gene_type:complete
MFTFVTPPPPSLTLTAPVKFIVVVPVEGTAGPLFTVTKRLPPLTIPERSIVLFKTLAPLLL